MTTKLQINIGSYITYTTTQLCILRYYRSLILTSYEINLKIPNGMNIFSTTEKVFALWDR